MRSAVRNIQSDLSAGELSADMHARSDLEAYFKGAAQLANFLPQITGGAVKRGGLEFLGEVSDSTEKHRLIPFHFGRNETFIIELADLEARIRSRTDGAYVQNSTPAVIVLTTPWGQNDLDGITYFQSGDVIYLGHQDRDQSWKTIRRNADDDWTIHDFAFREGPFLPENSTAGLFITPSATTGAITLASGAAVFDADMVGGLFYHRPAAPSLNSDLWQENKAYVIGDVVNYGGRVYQSQTNANSGFYPPIHDAGSASDGGVTWLYVHDGFGVFEITSVTSSTIAAATVTRTLPAAAASTYWAEGAYSDFRGYPACGVVHEERMFFFNTPGEPDTAKASRVGDYDPDGAGFRPETAFGVIADGDGFSATIADGTVNPIHAAVSADRLYVFTEANVKRISGPTQDEPITASGRVAREVSNIGARRGPVPVKVDDAVLYVRADGRGMQELPYDGGAQRDLLVRARHAAASPFEEIVPAAYPDRRVVARRADGGLWTLAYSRSDNMVAWSPISPGGAFDGGAPVIESVTVIAGAAGEDEIWCIVKRTVNSATIRTVERLVRAWDAGRDRPDEQRYLDAFETYDQWNSDTSKTLTLALDVAGESQPGDTGTLTASGHTPFTVGSVGDTYFLRKTSAPVRSSDEPGPLEVVVTAYTSATQVDVELVSSAPAALTAVALDEWALGVDTCGSLTHLEGEEVYALADGEPMGPFTVASGSITLTREAARICVGLKYTAEVRSMPIEPGSALGSGRGAVGRVNELTVMLKDTIGGRIGVYGARQLEDLVVRTAADDLGRMFDPASGDFTVHPEGGSQREVQLSLVHDDPTACTVLGIAAEVEVNA